MLGLPRRVRPLEICKVKLWLDLPAGLGKGAKIWQVKSLTKGAPQC